MLQTKVLSDLITPLLADLCIEFGSMFASTGRSNLGPALIEYQERSKCSITHLSLIRAHSLTNKGLMSIIDEFTVSLQSLTVIAKKISPKNLLQKLVCKKTKTPSLPYLEYLCFSCTEEDFASLPVNVLVDVIESRWNTADRSRFRVYSQLKKVQMTKLIPKAFSLRECDSAYSGTSDSEEVGSDPDADDTSSSSGSEDSSTPDGSGSQPSGNVKGKSKSKGKGKGREWLDTDMELDAISSSALAGGEDSSSTSANVKGKDKSKDKGKGKAKADADSGDEGEENELWLPRRLKPSEEKRLEFVVKEGFQFVVEIFYLPNRMVDC
ncbi:hypothetical protein GYMLUDRAFT_494621 [Collybiopsis luxurians FD-317 M1]|uniref:Uncharacterized protein n=1 Tax=Collybiopsis luxurians FD-317 M1 TaxID=944289 RepID=A0A0D0BX76_9AGAR|nr:hypothetical protein GYMLUDRAFT_494621 [Collybiopsis luxurians FD-317 M1]